VKAQENERNKEEENRKDGRIPAALEESMNNYYQ